MCIFNLFISLHDNEVKLAPLNDGFGCFLLREGARSAVIIYTIFQDIKVSGHAAYSPTVQWTKVKGSDPYTSPIDGRLSGFLCMHRYAALAMRYNSYVSYESTIRWSMSSCSASLSISGSAWHPSQKVFWIQTKEKIRENQKLIIAEKDELKHQHTHCRSDCCPSTRFKSTTFCPDISCKRTMPNA